MASAAGGRARTSGMPPSWTRSSAPPWPASWTRFERCWNRHRLLATTATSSRPSWPASAWASRWPRRTRPSSMPRALSGIRPLIGFSRPPTGRMTRWRRSSVDSPRPACGSARPPPSRLLPTSCAATTSCGSTRPRPGQCSLRSPTCDSCSASGWAAHGRRRPPPRGDGRGAGPRRPVGVRPLGLRLPHLAAGDPGLGDARPLSTTASRHGCGPPNAPPAEEVGQ